MKRGELKALGLIYTAGAKPGTFTDTIMNQIFKNAALDLAAFGVLLPTSGLFNAVAYTGFGAATYDLNTVVEGFLVPDRPGLWWNSGTALAPKWKEILPKTEEWMNEYRRNWKDESPGEPQYYWTKYNNLYVWPGPNASLASGFKFHYGRTPFAVANDDQYYFFGSVEWPNFSLLDESMMLYFKWKSLGALGKEDNYQIAKRTYESERAEKIGILKQNLALNQTRYNRYQPMGRQRLGGRFRS